MKSTRSSIFGRTDVEIGRISDTLSEIDPRVIGRILTREYPQTAALVLSQLAPKEAAEARNATVLVLRTDTALTFALIAVINREPAAFVIAIATNTN